MKFESRTERIDLTLSDKDKDAAMQQLVLDAVKDEWRLVGAMTSWDSQSYYLVFERAILPAAPVGILETAPGAE